MIVPLVVHVLANVQTTQFLKAIFIKSTLKNALIVVIVLMYVQLRQ